MHLEDFVNGLDDGAFRSLMDACVCRLQSAPRLTLTEAERELASLQKIKAIKCVRQRLGIGLKDAKDLVDREAPQRLVSVMFESERVLAHSDRRGAVIAVKDRLDLDLEEAKELVDREVPWQGGSGW